jgi:3-deoxy-manno-octulosonate cytidylyltransferase (CMP-KDO synthetase)
VAQVAAALIRGEADVATACVPISDESEWRDPNVVKVVRDSHGQALYFSRAPIPYNRDGDAGTLPAYGAFRHIGIYAYRTPVLARLADTAPCALEVSESLEQLRAQWLGLRLAVVDACEPPGPGVDTEADLTAVQKIIGDTKVAS